MNLLEFARGPGLTISLIIFALGVIWRLWGIFRLGKKPDHSAPRSTATTAGAWRMIFSRMWPRREFQAASGGATFNGYLYHLGWFIAFLAFLPHIAFVERLTGLSWPALPDAVMAVATAVAILGLVIALARRLTDPVLRLLSNFDDYFTWLVTMLPLITGMALIHGSYYGLESIPPTPYTTPLALHLLSLELLLIWMPFGKLSHAFLVFISRGTTGAAFARKGAQP
jgi:nitrate reductase gamma subunit